MERRVRSGQVDPTRTAVSWRSHSGGAQRPEVRSGPVDTPMFVSQAAQETVAMNELQRALTDCDRAGSLVACQWENPC